MEIQTACPKEPTVVGEIDHHIRLSAGVCQRVDLSPNQMRDRRFKTDAWSNVYTIARDDFEFASGINSFANRRDTLDKWKPYCEGNVLANHHQVIFEVTSFDLSIVGDQKC